jgi:hypothetical protein
MIRIALIKKTILFEMYGKDSPTKSNYAIGRDCFIFLDDRLFVFSALTLKNKSMDVSLTNTIYVN